MRIEIVVFEGFDDLDAVAPYEVLRHAARRVEGWDVVLVGAHGPGEVRSAHGLTYRVDAGLAAGPAPDGVVVAGGGWHDPGPGARAEVDDGRLPARLAALAPELRWTASVCTGGLILAAAGLLDGRRATTHHSAFDDLAGYGALVDRRVRVLDAGPVVTAGAVTSGLDLALHLVAREAGEDVADDVAAHVAHPRIPALVVG